MPSKKSSKKTVKKAVPKLKEKAIPLRKHLEALSESALIDLMLELAKKHGTVRDELKDRFSTTDQRIAKLETTITQFRPQYRGYRGHGSNVEKQVRKLIDSVRHDVDDPVQAMKLLVKIFEKDGAVCESGEDAMGEVFTCDATELFEELAKRIDDKKYIEDILYKLL